MHNTEKDIYVQQAMEIAGDTSQSILRQRILFDELITFIIQSTMQSIHTEIHHTDHTIRDNTQPSPTLL